MAEQDKTKREKEEAKICNQKGIMTEKKRAHTKNSSKQPNWMMRKRVHVCIVLLFRSIQIRVPSFLHALHATVRMGFWIDSFRLRYEWVYRVGFPFAMPRFSNEFDYLFEFALYF